MNTILKNTEIQHQGLNSNLWTTVEIFTEKPSIELKLKQFRSGSLQSETEKLIKILSILYKDSGI